MALGVAAMALEGRRGLENIPQGSSAGITAGGEVVERKDELVALVVDVSRTISIQRWVHYSLLVTFKLAFIVVQDLGK